MPLPAGFTRLKPIVPPLGAPLVQTAAQSRADVPEPQSGVSPAEPPATPQPSKLPPGYKRDAAAPASPSLGEQAKVAGAGALRGFADMLPLSGSMLGAVVGGAVGGPAAIATGAGGMLLGGEAGMAAKRVLDDMIDVPAAEDLPPELRPAREFGEVLGGSVGPGGVPFAAAKTGFRAGRFLNRVIETAAAKPKTIIASETAGAVGSGVGGAVAETVDPGDVGTRVAGEVAGGVALPTQWLFTAKDIAMTGIGAIRRSMSQAGRESAAATELQRILAEHGEDPAALAQQLEAAVRRHGLPGTSAQLTGNPALVGLEATLAQRNVPFGVAAQKQGQAALTTLRATADTLARSGEPAALQEAARLRSEYFKMAMQQMVDSAEKTAVDAGAQIGSTSTESASALSQRVGAIADNALKAARTTERGLYELVPNGPKEATNFLTEVDRIKAQDLLPEERLPPLVESYAKRIAGDMKDEEVATGLLDASGKAITRTVPGNPQPTTIKELRLLRTRMLDEARAADKNGDAATGRIFGHLAEAALDDLGVDAAAGTPLGIAREYSKQLNDMFTRSFAGETIATKAVGSRRLPPELIMRRATGTGEEVAALRIKELQRAVEFGSKDTPAAAQELLGIQEQFIRRSAENLLDPDTGLVNRRRLILFQRKFGESLDMFPELKDQLATAEGAQQFLQGVTGRTKVAGQVINKRAAFARVAQSENPVQTVNRMLMGPRPQEDVRQLAALARRDGEPAVAGLQSAVMEDAFTRAGGNTDNFSFEKYRKTLFDPLRPGQPSTVDMLRANGVIDAPTQQRLETLLTDAQRIEHAMKSGEGLDDLLTSENALFDLALRVTGAKIGSTASSLGGGSAGGHTLIGAAAGSRFARQIFEKLPTGRVQDVLIEAAKNPEFMATLLKRGRTPRERIKIGMKLNAYVISALGQGAQDAGTPEQPAP